MGEGYSWYYECQECFGAIFDSDGYFPENCPNCGSSRDKWKRIEADEEGNDD